MPSRKERIASLEKQIVTVKMQIDGLASKKVTIKGLEDEADALEKKFKQEAETYQEARKKANEDLAAAQGKVANLDEQINGLRSKIANTKQAIAEIDAECVTLQDKSSGLYESVQVRTAKRDQRYSKLAKEALQLLSEKTGQQIDTSDYTLNDILSVTHSKGLPKTSRGNA